MAGDLSAHQAHAFYAYDSVHEREDGPSFEVLGGNFIHLLAGLWQETREAMSFQERVLPLFRLKNSICFKTAVEKHKS